MPAGHEQNHGDEIPNVFPRYYLQYVLLASNIKLISQWSKLIMAHGKIM